MRLFHGTGAASVINTFDAFSHFGTRRAALEVVLAKAGVNAIERVAQKRTGQPFRRRSIAAQRKARLDVATSKAPLEKEDFRGLRLYEIDLAVEAALEIEDAGRTTCSEHISVPVAAALGAWHPLDQPVDQIPDDPERRVIELDVLEDMLGKAGYDGLWYYNTREDEGSKSYVNARENQAAVVSVSEIEGEGVFENAGIEIETFLLECGGYSE